MKGAATDLVPAPLVVQDSAAGRGRRSDLNKLRCWRTAGPASRFLCRCVEEAGTAAHSGIWQNKINPRSRRGVTCDRRHHAAHLFEAGESEKRRGATVRLRTHDVEARLRLGKICRTSSAHGSTGMQVRVDFKRDLRGGLQPHIEVESNLGEEGQVRPEPGCNKHLGRTVKVTAVLCRKLSLAFTHQDLFRAKTSDEVDNSVLDGLLCPLPQRAAFGQLVFTAPAECVPDGAAPQHPGDACIWVALRDTGEGP